MTPKVRVLLCDDEALFRAGLKAVLGAQPRLEVVGEAAEGLAAVHEVARLRPDVVLMDLEMRHLGGGIEATRRITHTYPETRVLILTRYLEQHLVARCLEAGARGYFLKNEPVAQLAYAVEAVAGGGRYLSPAALDKVIDPSGQPLPRKRTRYDRLTNREREVLTLLGEGLTIKQVAAGLGCSVKTAEVHKYNLMRKLDVHDRAGLVKFAIAHRLVQVPVLEDVAEPGCAPDHPPISPALHGLTS